MTSLLHLSSYLKDITHHNSIREMIETHGLQNVLPGVTSMEEALEIYGRYYSPDMEKTGVIGLVID